VVYIAEASPVGKWVVGVVVRGPAGFAERLSAWLSQRELFAKRKALGRGNFTQI
jgi:hypothetical protein